MRKNALPEHSLREEYIARINRVVDYIDSHLDEGLSLEGLSRVANFSPYHFHRIFRAIVGEPLFQYIQRLRLEKAAGQLAADFRKPVTAVAFDCGFSGSAPFARAFREYFGMSATEWRRRKRAGSGKSKTGKTESKIRKTESNDGKAKTSLPGYIRDDRTNRIRRNKMKGKLSYSVEVREIPEMTVAYVRHIGPYKGDAALFEELFSRLFRWAGPRNLCVAGETAVLTVYHDNYGITDENNLRLSVCISVPAETRVDGEISKMKLAAGRYAVARFELGSDEFERAYQAIFGEWLPESGYQPDDRPSYEMYAGDPADHPEGKHTVDICIPVKPL